MHHVYWGGNDGECLCVWGPILTDDMVCDPAGLPDLDPSEFGFRTQDFGHHGCGDTRRHLPAPT